MKIIKSSKKTGFSIREEDGVYYIFVDDDHVLATPGGNDVYTAFKPIALRLLKDLEKYGYEYTNIASILSWHFTTIDNFAPRGEEKIVEILDDCFLKRFDWTLHCSAPDPHIMMNWLNVFGSPDKVPQELRKWLEGLTIMQLSAACCVANQYKSLNVAYVFSLLTDKIAKENFKEAVKDFVDFFTMVAPSLATRKELMDDIKTFKLYYEQTKK